MTEKGGISVETKNIFPIIKRWLYSEKEIFLRELISNSNDAVTKLKRLLSIGEVRLEDLQENDGDSINYRIDIKYDSQKSTLSVIDNGIGMTADEIKKYINQIAISGALEFLEKYEANENDSEKNMEDGQKNGIIGHFGLGFYSAFMVADKVDIKSKSYTDAPCVFWSGEESGEFEMTENPADPSMAKTNRGTEIILHISDENKEYLSEYKIKDILEKYCAFMPVEIYLSDANKVCEHKHGEKHSHGEGECEDCEHEHDDGNPHGGEHICSCKPINETNPLWNKNPTSCTEEEYGEFYHKVFRDYKEPLFHIHINADYPLNFKGILYFPKINTQFDSLEGEVKLYYNQVFVADNIKEIVPEYLLMLKGVLDCPELPLNVSRSYLQNSGYVSKISAHIIKKVGDKLSSLFNTEKEKYENFWGDIKTFIQYGCLRDRKFYDRVKNIIIYKTTEGKYKTLEEYLQNKEAVEETSGDKKEKTVNVYYTSDPVAQSVYVNMYKRMGKEVILLENIIETQFINLVEMDYANDKDKTAIKFVRVDSEIKNDGARDKETEEKLLDLFQNAVGENANVKFEAKPLDDDKVPALLVISEQSRRMAELMKQYQMIDKNVPTPPQYEEILIINTSNKLIKKLAEAEQSEKTQKTAKHLYSLAVVNSRKLTAEELENLMDESVDLLYNII